MRDNQATNKQKTKTLVRKFIYLIDFPKISLFFFSFVCFFCLVFFFACFFVSLKLKTYILINIRLCRRVNVKKFTPGRFPETRLLFWPHGCNSGRNMSLLIKNDLLGSRHDLLGSRHEFFVSFSFIFASKGEILQKIQLYLKSYVLILVFLLR